MTEFGLSEAELRFLQESIRQCLPAGAVGPVWIFGSRATGKYRKYSDVDILIDVSFLSEKESAQKCWSDIAELFEESNFPYKVDLVDAKKLSQAYAPSILATRKLFFEV